MNNTQTTIQTVHTHTEIITLLGNPDLYMATDLKIRSGVATFMIRQRLPEFPFEIGEGHTRLLPYPRTNE